MQIIAKTVSQDELTRLKMQYDAARRAFAGPVQDRPDDYKNPYMKRYLPWGSFHNAGVLYVQALMGSKEPPAVNKKDFAKAVKLFMGTVRMPNNVVAWVWDNAALLNMLRTADQWPDKVEGDAPGAASVFKVGPFTAHNNLGVTGTALDTITDALKRAATLLKATNIPNIEKVLYGDVMIVGNIAKSNHLAWYYKNEDVVYVRPFKKVGVDELHRIIHELGHRYVSKFLPRQEFSKWSGYHQSLQWKRIDVSPKELHVGDEMPFRIKGIKGTPVIQKIEEKPPMKTRMVYFSERVVTTEPSVKMWLRDAEEQSQKYPTAYAAKDAEEHFCEALALYAMGKLEEPHLANFKSIIEKGEMPSKNVSASAKRVAAQYMKARFFPRLFPDDTVDEAMDAKNQVNRSLELAVIPGQPNLRLPDNELDSYAEGNLPNPFGFYSNYLITKPRNSAREAYQDAEAEVDRYTQHKQAILQQARTVMLIFWKDKGLWSAVINYREIQ